VYAEVFCRLFLKLQIRDLIIMTTLVLASLDAFNFAINRKGKINNKQINCKINVYLYKRAYHGMGNLIGK
jgi:hypothetical protein